MPPSLSTHTWSLRAAFNEGFVAGRRPLLSPATSWRESRTAREESAMDQHPAGVEEMWKFAQAAEARNIQQAEDVRRIATALEQLVEVLKDLRDTVEVVG